MIDIKRPEEAPESLAMRRYNGVDVIRALYDAFLGKCYLCETDIKPGTLEVDHRKRKTDFPDLEFSWTNLFPTCNIHRCNQRRDGKYPDGGLLDPGAGHNVEGRLSQSLEKAASGVLGTDVRFCFKATSADDSAARNTAKELDRIHNGTGSSKRAQLTAYDLREGIRDHIATRVTPMVHAFIRTPLDEQEKRRELESILRKLFSRRAPYTMLVRSYFSHRPEIRALFEDSP